FSLAEGAEIEKNEDDLDVVLLRYFNGGRHVVHHVVVHAGNCSIGIENDSGTHVAEEEPANDGDSLAMQISEVGLDEFLRVRNGDSDATPGAYSEIVSVVGPGIIDAGCESGDVEKIFARMAEIAFPDNTRSQPQQ